MRWSTVAGMALIAVALAGVVALVHGCSESEDRAYRDWLEYVAQHHCSVIPTKWYEANRWQCDGFQVEHE